MHATHYLSIQMNNKIVFVQNSYFGTSNQKYRDDEEDELQYHHL
jgi:hypothetical protein